MLHLLRHLFEILLRLKDGLLRFPLFQFKLLLTASHDGSSLEDRSLVHAFDLALHSRLLLLVGSCFLIAGLFRILLDLH